MSAVVPIAIAALAAGAIAASNSGAPVAADNPLPAPDPLGTDSNTPSNPLGDVYIDPAYTGGANLVAFLAVIRLGESSDNYTALVGGGNFASFVDHPYLTGEFKGIVRADGRLTTAAGAYQITKSTWLDLGGVAKYGNFSPASQDQAAIDLISRRGALQAIYAGNLISARALLLNEWECFKIGNLSKFDNVAAAFVGNGGVLA